MSSTDAPAPAADAPAPAADAPAASENFLQKAGHMAHDAVNKTGEVLHKVHETYGGRNRDRTGTAKG